VIHLLWDSSALAKRYTPEGGSDTVDALWLTALRQSATFPCYAETYSILLRKRNQSVISMGSFSAAISSLRLEIAHNLDFTLLETDTRDILASIALMEKHSLNSSDAAMLATFLRYARPLEMPAFWLPLMAVSVALPAQKVWPRLIQRLCRRQRSSLF